MISSPYRSAVTLVQLETFRRLVRLGNFTRTAEELGLTQSAVTQQMRALERQVGTPLFDLVGRRPELTDAGALLVERSAEILDGVETLGREMREFAAARTGVLALGATVTIGSYALPQQLAAFKRLVPNVDARVTVANTTEICIAVKARRVGLALVEGSVNDDELSVVPYADDRLQLTVPSRGHRLSHRRSIVLADLRGETFVARERGSGTRKLADDTLAAAHVLIETALELPNNEGVLRAVEAGLGVAMVSELAVEREAARGTVRVVRIRDADLTRRFSIVALRSRTLSPIAERFLTFLLT